MVFTIKNALAAAVTDPMADAMEPAMFPIPDDTLPPAVDGGPVAVTTGLLT